MKKEDLVEFATRDRESPAWLKAEHWAERRKRLGEWEGLRVVAELREYARSLDPEWPTEEQREEDLATHMRVGAMLRRVSRD